jgi:hypothetical protein
MEITTKQIESLVESAKKSHKSLKELKLLAVRLNQYELGANLREIERELYPESEEVKKEKQSAEKLNTLFRMVGLNISNEACWIINATLKKYWKRRGNFDIKDAAELMDKKNQIFGE